MSEYTLQETASTLGVTYRTMMNYIGSGELPAKKYGGRWHVASEDLTAFMTKKRNREGVTLFENDLHKTLYLEFLSRGDEESPYFRALCYLLALICDRGDAWRAEDLFDFNAGCIKPDALRMPWQTSSTKRAARLAFNLYADSTNWIDTEDKAEQAEELAQYAPAALFSDPQWRPYMLEAVRIRYECN